LKILQIGLRSSYHTSAYHYYLWCSCCNTLCWF